LVQFGISAESYPLERRETARSSRTPIRILAPGNDTERDWTTLLEAVRNEANLEVRIATRQLPNEMGIPVASNVVVGPAVNLRDMRALYASADVVVIPLKPNLHASGITAILEAVACGVPVISSDTGGLRAYFGDEAVIYVPPSDSAALQQAIHFVSANEEVAASLVRHAQDAIEREGLTSHAYAARHVTLTRELLERCG
jgi:glycosyltransferase involved in cell wall biosynthesis